MTVQCRRLPCSLRGPDQPGLGRAARARRHPSQFGVRARQPGHEHADPFPPWSLEDQEDPQAPRKEVLNLFFADANAAQRCRDFSTFELEDYVEAVDDVIESEDHALIEARCGQCMDMSVGVGGTQIRRFGTVGVVQFKWRESPWDFGEGSWRSDSYVTVLQQY